MSLNCGIIGLPNVGKSTIFQALTTTPTAAENYPFCTIEPNVGIVPVPDARMEQICRYIVPQKRVPASVEFVDIAGLVKGASQGEGLGNQFLGHIREAAAIMHVVRCFEDSEIIHVHGEVDPVSDIETINVELCLADLEAVNKKYETLPKMLKSQDQQLQKQARLLKPLLEKLQQALGEGKSVRSVVVEDEEREDLRRLQLITMKQVLYVCNVNEECLGKGNHLVQQVVEHARREGSGEVMICGKLEAEIAALDTLQERQEFLADTGLTTQGLERLVQRAYDLLGLKTYFTAGEKEVRAWTYREGMTACECAGIIHTDFQRGFIKADTYHYDDLMEFKSEQRVREAGRLRQEGRDYRVKDGDIIHFKFNV